MISSSPRYSHNKPTGGSPRSGRMFILCGCIFIVSAWIGSYLPGFIFSPIPTDNHTGIYHSSGVPLSESSLPFTPQLAQYNGGKHPLLAPTWIVTSPDQSTVHRFFDTSPFSPSNRYLGVTRMLVNENRAVKIGDRAQIVVTDLHTGNATVVAETTAWDSQVGAHVQWGRNDNELYFNTILSDENHKHRERPVGVVLNVHTQEKRTLDCPIYQVSPNGEYSAAPDLTMIKYTQLGYGVFVHHTHASTNASRTNGLFLTNLETGTCSLLVSLYDIAKFAGIPTDVPMYGFHVKWSSDNKMIMFVVRTLSTGPGKWFSLRGSPKVARINHMFAVSPTGQILTHVVSWGSACGILDTHSYNSRITHVIGDLAVRGDGNHPSWIPDSHNISLNYRQVCDYDASSSVGKVPVWKIAVFNVDALIASAEKKKYDSAKHSPGAYRGITRGVIEYDFGTGHPNYFSGGRFMITDAYLKERSMFGSSLNAKEDGMLPLRLIDTLRKKEVWLMQVNLKRHIIRRDESGAAYIESKKSRRWRCDMHPAFSRDYSWVAINGRPGGHLRQVLISYIGNSPSKFFHDVN